MWSEQNEKDFQDLIEKYKADPSRKDFRREEIELIRHLVECYKEADPKPGAEIPFFEKLTNLYNIFLEAYAKKHSEMFRDKKTFDETLKQAPLQDEYMFLKLISAVTDQMLIGQDSEAFQEVLENAKAAYVNFLKPPLIDLLNEKQKDYLSPGRNYGFPYASPKPDPDNILSLPFNKMVEKIYNDAELKHQGELKLTKERDELIQARYRFFRLRGLLALKDLYKYLSPDCLLELPHLCYTGKGGDARFYPELSVKDILPHPLFKQVIKLQCSQSGFVNSYDRRPLVELLGKMIIEENPAFSGYSVILKTKGKEPGFILVSPDGKSDILLKLQRMPFRNIFVRKF